MSTKITRERAALEQAEKDLEARRQKLAELEELEAQKMLDRLVKKLGRGRSIEILQAAAELKPKVALERLKGSSGSPASA